VPDGRAFRGARRAETVSGCTRRSGVRSARLPEREATRGRVSAALTSGSRETHGWAIRPDEEEPVEWRRLGTGRLVVGEHRQKGLPGAHLVAELLGHDSSDLSDVPEVMHYPG